MFSKSKLNEKLHFYFKIKNKSHSMNPDSPVFEKNNRKDSQSSSPSPGVKPENWTMKDIKEIIIMEEDDEEEKSEFATCKNSIASLNSREVFSDAALKRCIKLSDLEFCVKFEF